MNSLDQKRDVLQETMTFMAAMAYGMEQLADRGANGMAYVAGKRLGRKFSEDAKKTTDVEEAIAEVRRVLEANNCLWHFEPFRLKGQADTVVHEDGHEQVSLVFRDCMIRQALFAFGHEQRMSMCTMMYGFFAGALETILGREAKLDIIHAGPNACLKTLTIMPPATA